MSTKFEQLLDYLVNEEMDKANELFHEIVVEKSRDIYENLIAEEAEEDEEMDEASEEEDESVDESSEDDEEEMDESAEELEDSYSMETGDNGFGGGDEGDATDDLGADVGADDSEMGGEEGSEESAIFDIKNAIEELEAAFAELSQAKGMGGGDEFGSDDSADADSDMGDEDEMEMMGTPAFEGRRLTREYTEKVGKPTGEIAGANTGEKMPNPENNKAPLSSGKGKPTTGATAHNILGKSATSAEDGTKPHGKVGGVLKAGGKFTGSGTHNVDGVKSGIKTVTKQGSGYPGNNKTAGPVGSGSGDKAGQTSVGQVKSPINGAPGRAA